MADTVNISEAQAQAKHELAMKFTRLPEGTAAEKSAKAAFFHEHPSLATVFSGRHFPKPERTASSAPQTETAETLAPKPAPTEPPLTT